MNNIRTKSDPKWGLNEEQVTESRRAHGSNSMTPPRRTGFFAHFIKNLNDPVIKILIAALILNVLFVFRTADWVETAGIAISVFLATFISTLSEYGSESAFSKLNEENENYLCRVRRAGRVIELPLSEIVCGDVVLLSAGDRIPADGFMICGRLLVDQVAMTGESREVEKLPRRNEALSPASVSALLRGCSVIAGDAEMEVASVGDATMIGTISREITLDTRESPLKLRLGKLAKQISRLGYAAAILIGLAYLFNAFILDSGMRSQIILLRLSDLPFVLTTLLDAFTLGLTIVVVSVPEGLPLMIAVVLSSNIKKMIRDKVLVRKPVGIESAGSMNILFTDKTGTLTEGIISVSGLFTDREEFRSPEALRTANPRLFTYYRLSALLNTSAALSGVDVIGGNATERALLLSVAPFGCEAPCRIIEKKPFDSVRKCSSASVAYEGGITLVKGAPERLLGRVRYSLDTEGRPLPFDRAAFCAKMNQLTASGIRVILMAYAQGIERENGDLTLICGVALADKLRTEAEPSVRALREAGVHIVMITGDNVDTAKSIASTCGIVTKKTPLCITGDELTTMDDQKLASLLPKLAVVARALPGDKSRLVRIAQEMGLVCGMTGDGINDAPALKRADIGFAMGNGTQVAKQAGDIIILDNNLASIVRAVLYGRNIFKSIRKFIVLQLTMNLSAVGVSMIGPFIGIDAPVTVVQMLWVNIIMDTLGGLAFAGEPPHPSAMKEPPKRRDEPILNGYMVNQIVLLGSFTVALSLAFLTHPFFTAHFRGASNDIYLLTAFFAFFIFAGVFNCFNARSDRLHLLAGLSQNRPFLLIMPTILIIQLIFVYLGGDVLRSVPLHTEELLTSLASALLVFPADAVRKLIWKWFVRKPRY